MFYSVVNRRPCIRRLIPCVLQCGQYTTLHQEAHTLCFTVWSIDNLASGGSYLMFYSVVNR